VALRPEPNQLIELSNQFKMYYKKVDGKTPTSYSMDHSAGKYIFDTKGNIRLFSKYGETAEAITQDIKNL
jgi:protein SCO1/2